MKKLEIKIKSKEKKEYKKYRKHTYGTSYFRKVIILADPDPPTI